MIHLKRILDTSSNTLALDFEDKCKLLAPTLGFCGVFFFCYYSALIIPKFGIDSTIFLIDNIGGMFIIFGFVTSIVLTKRIKNHFLLILPSLTTVATTSLFLIHKEFYISSSHLWLSSQIIGIVFSSYLGLPKWNLALFILNASVPPLIASQYSHLEVDVVIWQQAIVYFASLISIYLSYGFLLKKSKLTDARDRALMAENIKSQFLANMSHELRTPMNGVVGTLQLLQREQLDKQQMELVERGLLSSKSLLSLINDILDFSKMESGLLHLEVIETDVVAVTEEAMTEISLWAKDKGLTVKLDVQPKLNRGWLTDPVRFKQVLLNLLSNGLKFTDFGTVTVKLFERDKSLHLQVSDTGIGMDKQALDSLFERFSQADVSTTRQFGGSGLGMAICQQIVQLMAGSIEVTSQPGQGSTFHVVLPLQQVALIDGEQTAKQLQAPELSGICVLLAEDNKVNQKVFEAMMVQTGAELLIANDGQEAVDCFNRREPALVFLDIQMPNLNGMEACKLIKQRNPLVPVIAITANVFEDDVQSYLAAGFEQCLAKPLDINALYRLLEQKSADLFNQ